MSLFPRTFYRPDVSFNPLFRLLDDFDNYSREVQGDHEGRRWSRATRAFDTKFDVRETEKAFELHGEVPGVERDNLNIEFIDPHTLVIRGRVERSYSAGTPPAGLVEGAADKKAAITEGGENARETITEHDDKQQADKQQVDKQQVDKHQADKQRADKYWVSERSFGEFSRTFSFPTPVDQDGVTAGLNNGILSVTVPKAGKKETRRININ